MWMCRAIASCPKNGHGRAHMVLVAVVCDESKCDADHHLIELALAAALMQMTRTVNASGRLGPLYADDLGTLQRA